jgi:hypothetical protein
MIFQKVYKKQIHFDSKIVYLPQILWGCHDNELDRPFIAKYFISPSSDRTNGFHCSYTIVRNQNLLYDNRFIASQRFYI